MVFDQPQGYGYKFGYNFDLASEFGTIGNNFTLTLNWQTDVYPLPQKVVVVLPQGFDFVALQGDPTDYTKKTENGGVSVSFEGTAPPNGGFYWTIVYAEIAQEIC